MVPVDQTAPPPMRDPSVLNHHPWVEPVPAWIMQQSAVLSEAEVLEEQMLHAGILASLQDGPEDIDAKVEVPKSSVSSLRLVFILIIIYTKLFTLFPTYSHIHVISNNQFTKRPMLLPFRLQQLEKMGFATEKAVVALAASKQLDGAIALLIDDSVGEQAVVTSKGKNPMPPQNT